MTTSVVKRKQRIVASGGVTTSFSEMSLVQPSSKRTRTITTADVVTETESNKKPDYLKLPDAIFKKMLSTALEGAEEYINTVLDTKEKLQYARIYAQLVHELFYLRLKEDFWKHYSTMMAPVPEIRSLNLSKSILKEHSLQRLQFVTPENLHKREQKMIEQVKQIEDQLNEHKKRATMVAADLSIDLRKLSTVITAFVRKGQHKLTADFERRKRLLEYDIHDYCLIRAFYNLKPSKDQV